jgi:type IV secretory pathway VirB9-like protein
VWTPRQIVDDGRKTYILLPQNLGAMPAPMMRLIGPNGPELFNPRQIDSLLIVDYLFNQVELRVGTGQTAEVVRLTRDMPRTIHCPGDEACPVWPAFVQSGP